MVRADITWFAHTGNGLVEHASQRDTIDIASLHTEADDPPRELVHDDNDPVGLQQNGLAPKQIDASKAVLHVTDEGQPRGAAIARFRTIVLGEDTPHEVLVDVYATGLGN